MMQLEIQEIKWAVSGSSETDGVNQMVWINAAGNESPLLEGGKEIKYDFKTDGRKIAKIRTKNQDGSYNCVLGYKFYDD